MLLWSCGLSCLGVVVVGVVMLLRLLFPGTTQHSGCRGPSKGFSALTNWELCSSLLAFSSPGPASGDIQAEREDVAGGGVRLLVALPGCSQASRMACTFCCCSRWCRLAGLQLVVLATGMPFLSRPSFFRSQALRASLPQFSSQTH